ncbi:Endonuclease V [Geodia barretti]|uniref:Endonuclease V n=1 Tax=Geodia barretti TaxID=519541 RepID=A0AA35TD58_GEOBA|nr:Endonuclease V [Geodia barretti]
MLHLFMAHPGPATVGSEEGEEGGSEAESEGGEEEGEDKRLSPDECAKRRKWEREQEELKERLEVEDGEEVASWEGDTLPFARLTTIAGVDISFDKAHPDHACAMLTVLTYPQLKVVHESRAVVEMREPYIPGFLAFREVDFLLERLREVQRQHPQHYPQVILVDGNGILHPRGCAYVS